jgi:hypothetical protein
MKKNIPIFEFIINDSEEEYGVKAISIVDDPAFQSSLVTFNANKPKYVQLADNKGKKKKQICAGLSLIPNVLIYRFDEIFGEYFGYFTAETIERIVEKYHEELNNNKINLNHDPSKYINAFMVSDYIVDSQEKVADLKRIGIEHENIMGSWFTSFKIKDPQVFEQILKGDTKSGFSIEAVLDTYLVQAQNQINENKIKKEMKKEKKNILEKIIEIFKTDNFERALVPELGFQIEWTEVGSPVNQVNVDEQGNEVLVPLGAGEFKTEDSVIVVDDSSNLVEIRELPEPEPELKLPDEEMKTEETVSEMESEPQKNLEIPVEEIPVEEPEIPVVDVKSKTIGELVGENDGEYWIKVVVESGEVKEAEVSSETNLLKEKLSKFEEQTDQLEKENDKLKEKLKEPIGDPILQPTVEKKDWSKMSAYEKTLYRARQGN